MNADAENPAAPDSVKTPLEQLAARPQRFRFDAAVRLLLAATRSTARRDDKIDFVTPPVLWQPVSEVSDVTPAEAGRFRLTTSVIGLIGPSGVMPRWYTELVAQSARARSRGIVDFFDLLAQRFITAFSHAGIKYRLHRSAEAAFLENAPSEPIGDALLAFTGYNTAHLANRLAAGPDVLRHYAGFFASRARSAERLQRMVSDYLGRTAEIIEFAGAWLGIAPDQQSRLPRGRFPGAFHELGRNLAIGTRAWDQQARFIVRVGPLDRAEFEALLPDRNNLRELVSLVRAYVGWEADFAINLVLARSEIPPLQMAGRSAHGAPRLGWTSWLPSSTSAIRGQQSADEAMFGATLVEALD